MKLPHWGIMTGWVVLFVGVLILAHFLEPQYYQDIKMFLPVELWLLSIILGTAGLGAYAADSNKKWSSYALAAGLLVITPCTYLEYLWPLPFLGILFSPPLNLGSIPERFMIFTRWPGLPTFAAVVGVVFVWVGASLGAATLSRLAAVCLPRISRKFPGWFTSLLVFPIYGLLVLVYLIYMLLILLLAKNLGIYPYAIGKLRFG